MFVPPSPAETTPGSTRRPTISLEQQQEETDTPAVDGTGTDKQPPAARMVDTRRAEGGKGADAAPIVDEGASAAVAGVEATAGIMDDCLRVPVALLANEQASLGLSAAKQVRERKRE